jgi:hypothetical protein
MALPTIAGLTFRTNQVAAPAALGKSRYLNLSSKTVTMPDGSTVAPWQFWIKDGKLVEIEGKDAIKMFLAKIIKTEKNVYQVYKIIN